MRCGDGKEEFLQHEVEKRENNFLHKQLVELSAFYRIPSPQLKNNYTLNELKDMMADLEYINKKVDKK